MKLRYTYECEICGRVYFDKRTAINCETKCMGLTNEEYSEYKHLLNRLRIATNRLSAANITKNRDEYDEAIKAVVDFQKSHNIKTLIEVK